MRYKVLIEESDEGFAVSVPGLPGCHSQGATEQEALANIADAIREYLEVAAELSGTALLLALVPALVSVVLLAAPAGELMLLSPAIDLAAVMAASMLAAGRLPHGGISALDLAILAPLLAFLLVLAIRPEGLFPKVQG